MTNSMRLAGQIGLVNGAASGTGEAVAARAADEDATIVCLDRNNPSRVIEAIELSEGTFGTAAVIPVDGGWVAKATKKESTGMNVLSRRNSIS